MKAFTLVFGPPIAAMLALGQPKPPPAVTHAPQIEQTSHKTKPRVHRQAKPKVDKIAPGKAQPKPKKEQGKSAGSPIGLPKPRADEGPDLPYPCWLVRMHAAGKTRAQLEALGRANGISLTAKQRRQASECLK